MIQFNHVVVLHPDTEIIHPSLDVTGQGCIPVWHGYSPTTPGKATQPSFESMDGLLSGIQFHPYKRETKKGTVLSSVLPVSLRSVDLGPVGADQRWEIGQRYSQ